MSVTINAKGTSVPSFTIGKAGTNITQSGTISPPAGNDLTLSIEPGNNLVVDAGTSGPALITATNDQDLHINPATGGGQYLILCADRWPATDGTAEQVITTDGSGVLSFQTPTKIGTPAPSTDAVSGFAYIPVTTGTPTGTPTSISGYVPMVADSDGNKLWIYINGAWKSTTLS